MTPIVKQYEITKSGKKYVVELKIDIDHVATVLVNTAARNSSGNATVMRGAITAKVLK